MPITDFFSCLSTLKKFTNCGVLSSYLPSYAEWLSVQGFSRYTIRLSITNVAHFSFYLKESPQATIHHLNDYFDSFVFNHIPKCHCCGWKKRRRSKDVIYCLNRFKKYLTDCHEINFAPQFSAYPLIHQDYLHWLSENCGLAKSSIELRSTYLSQFLKWYSTESHSEDLQELKSYDVEDFFLRPQVGMANVINAPCKQHYGVFLIIAP